VCPLDKRLLGDQHPHVATSLNNLALLYSRQGRYTDAEPLYKQALEMRKRLLGDQHPHVATSLNNLAQLYRYQGNITKALEFRKQGLKVEEQNLSVNLSVGFERQRREYIRTTSGTTDATISLHLNSAFNNSQAANLALTTIFQRKGRILDVVTNDLQIIRQRVDDKSSLKLIDQLSNSYNQLASLIYSEPKKISPEHPRKIAELEQKIKDLENQLSRRSAEFANLSQELKSQTVTLADVRKLIPADAALVEIVSYRPLNLKAKQPNQRWGRNRYAAYVLNSTGKPQAIDLGEAANIKPTLESFRNSLKDRNTPQDQVKQSARDVDKLVMEPIRKLLGNKRKILIAPDGALNLIPFEALVDENNRYLIENYSFTYLSSGRDLLRLQNKSPRKITRNQSPRNQSSRNQSPNTQQSVIIADPLFHKQGEVVAVKPNKPNNTRSIDISNINFPPLIGTREEAKSIADMLGVKPFLETQASEGVIKELQSPKVLHIATHAFFKNPPQKSEHKNTYRDNPLLLSGLVLSGYENRQGGGNEDGILTALETTALNLTGTKLVVLSACDTSLGQDQTGEGLYSFRRALVIAGSESQVMSLWKVDDAATKDLMIAYYEKVLGKEGKQQGRSEALRQTQLEMLGGGKYQNKYQHPYYWAAFIPSGDWRAMGE
ncbi:MAG: CHAT domain-containing tetratricopeptide repeat protein, partial [Cyanobacteria bacterium J06639_18]